MGWAGRGELSNFSALYDKVLAPVGKYSSTMFAWRTSQSYEYDTPEESDRALLVRRSDSLG